MLKKVNRLPASVRLIQTNSINSRFFLLKKGKSNLDYCRFGFVISKKTANKAVDRNRSKRLIRACVESVLKDLPVGKDYIFIIRKNLSDVKIEEVDVEVKRVLGLD